MVYMANEIKWVARKWGTDIGTIVDIFEGNQGISEYLERRPRNYLGIWLAMRHMCTCDRCMTVDFRAYSGYFELDGVFAVEVLKCLVLVLCSIMEAWGVEQGVLTEILEVRGEEERVAEAERSVQQEVNKIVRSQNWIW